MAKKKEKNKTNNKTGMRFQKLYTGTYDFLLFWGQYLEGKEAK